MNYNPICKLSHNYLLVERFPHLGGSIRVQLLHLNHESEAWLATVTYKPSSYKVKMSNYVRLNALGLVGV